MDIVEPEEASQYGVVGDDGANLDKEDQVGSGDMGAIRDVDAAKIYTEESQKAVKDTYLLYYMTKPPSFITQGFKENKKAQNRLFKHMCNFAAWEE